MSRCPELGSKVNQATAREGGRRSGSRMGFARGLTWRRPRLLAPARKSAAGDSRAPGVSHARAHAHPSPPPRRVACGRGPAAQPAGAQTPSPRARVGSPVRAPAPHWELRRWCPRPTRGWPTRQAQWGGSNQSQSSAPRPRAHGSLRGSPIRGPPIVGSEAACPWARPLGQHVRDLRVHGRTAGHGALGRHRGRSPDSCLCFHPGGPWAGSVSFKAIGG